MADNANEKKVVTVWGRLSFPTWTPEEAYALSQKGDYKAPDVASAAPSFQLLLNQTQHDKLMEFISGTFLPYCATQAKAGEKRDSLTDKEVKALLEGLAGPLEDQIYNTPLKPVHEKSAALAPEAVSTLKVLGNKGVAIELKAIVRDEDELKAPDGSILSFPVIRPIGETNHQMYPGCQVAVTVNLYAYHNGKSPGFSAGATVAVFRGDDERFGGGVAVDEDAIFMD